MEVSAEAKRIMVVALGKLYSSRTQRGGLRLHRSLLLTLVMKSARDMYHAAQATAESAASEWGEPQQQQQQQPAAEMTTESCGAPGLQGPASPLITAQPRTLPPAEVVGSSTEPRRCALTARNGAADKENLRPPGPAQHTRKRRGKEAAEPDFLPCKKAKLEQGHGPPRLRGSSLLLDYVKCSSDRGAPPTPIPLQRVVAAC